MKRLLFVFILLGLCIPACADVLVYTEKYNETGFEIDPNTGVGVLYKHSGRAYRILEQVGDKIDDWTIELWRDKDANGVKQNYYEHDPDDDEWTGDFVTASSGKKLTWVISYGDETARLLLAGNAKNNKTIGSTVASKLDGYAIWDVVDDDQYDTKRNIGSAKISFRLDTKFTIKVKGLSGDDAVAEIEKELKSKGYKEGD